MNSIVFIIFYILAFVIPVILTLREFVSLKTAIIIAIGFSPLLVGFYNMINVAIGFHSRGMMYIFPLVITIAIYYKNKNVVQCLVDSKVYIKPLFYGLLLGSVYYYFFLYNYYSLGEINCDTMWNLGLINNFKNYITPNNPAWYSDNAFIYHYITNWCFAGMSNFSGISAVDIALGLGNIITAISIFIILFLMTGSRYIEVFIIFILTLIFSVKPDWILSNVLPRHFNGNAVTSYFWSLPYLFTSIYLFFKIRESRDFYDTKSILKFLFVNTLIVLVVGGTKISNLMILVCIELFLFLKMILYKRHYSVKEFLSYTLLPILTLLMIAFYSLTYSKASMVFGIEAGDFDSFKSWNIFYPLFVLYGVILVFIILNYKKYFLFKWEFLFAGFFNLAIFFVFKHAGKSDLFFGLNTVICNMLFLVFNEHKDKLKKYVYSIGIVIVIALLINDYKSDNFFKISFNTDDLRNRKSDYNYRNDNVKDLLLLSDSLPKNSFLIVGSQEKNYTTLFSAFLECRTWNESVWYSIHTNNSYYLVTRYLESKSVFPDFNLFPDLKEEYNEMLRKLSGVKVDTTIEKSNFRNEIYKKFVFSNIDSDEYMFFIDKYKWTHLVIKNEEYNDVNLLLKGKDRIQGNVYSIIKL